MDSTENRPGWANRFDKSFAGRPLFVRSLLGIVYWLFPFVLLGIGYLIGNFIPAFRGSVTGKWPIDDSIWLPLMALIILAIIWLLFDLFWVFSRETTSRSLQIRTAFTNLTGILLSIAFGYYINSEHGVAWWFIVPFIVSVVDVFTTAWAAINNATQKPFLSERGTE